MTETVVGAEVLSEVRGQVGFITLNRPRALNALSLGMVRDLMTTLLAWQADDRVLAVAIRGSNKEGPFGAFCAGGDIRFLHQAGSQGNPLIEDFFTEEYRPQPPDPQLHQALHRLHGWHRDGGRHGYQPGRGPARGDRAHQNGHA